MWAMGKALKSTVTTLGALSLTSLVMACGEAPSAPIAHDPAPTTTTTVVPFEDRFDERGVFIVDPQVPAAWRNDRTFAAQKGDQYDDQRAEAPQLYAITQPPRKPVRAMVEWEPMQALAMSFPGYMLQSTNATATVVQIAKVGSGYGDIWIFVDGAQAESGLKSRLASAGMSAGDIAAKVKFIRSSFDSIWFIDAGPLPIIDDSDGTYAFADFRYYHERPLDDGMPTWIGRNLAEQLARPSNVATYRMPLYLEGGTFQATTTGVCITGSRQIWNLSCDAGSCDDAILDTDLDTLKQNPYALEMKGILGSYAGCKDLIVTNSISDDGTGHIDMYLKILDDHRVLLGQYDPNSGNSYERENATLMDETAAFLEAYVLPDGEHFEVHRIPMPGHKSSTGFGSVPFTYINSTFFNGVNLWPATTYQSWTASRDAAQAVWDEVLPNIENVWIDATELSFYSGAIHCITRTIPAKTESLWVADGACAAGACDAPEGGYADECRPDGVDEDVCWGPAWLCDCNDCTNGCVPEPDACDGVAYEGCCDSGDLVYCDGGQLYRQACGGTGCGWDDQGGYYDCQQTGQDPAGDYPITCGGASSACDGKECGDDGAGGSCGSCDGGATCIAGVCRSDCDDCVAGTSGCDGDSAWWCQAGQDGCNSYSQLDCAAQGKVCEAGLCASSEPEPGVEPGPEATPDGGAETSDAGSDIDLTPEKSTATGKRDDGCAGGPPADLAIAVGASLLGLALRRQRLVVRRR